MKTIAVLGLIVALTGCGLKSNTFNLSGHGYAPKVEPHFGAVCQIASPLPRGVDHKVVGIVRGNRGWFGGFAPVREAMAEEARSAGIDVIVNLQMRQDVAFRGIFILRPVGEGIGVKLTDSRSFDCLASGGRIYPGSGLPSVFGPTDTPAVSEQGYDDCMERVMRISDSGLRLEAMSTCDDAYNAEGDAK